MSQSFAALAKEESISWSPSDRYHVSQFPMHEYIQSRFLSAEDYPEGYVSDEPPQAPCTKDTCDAEPCTASEHCTDANCDVAPCHDQDCSKFWDEIEPCITDCLVPHGEPCCEDSHCLEGWSFDDLCFAPHMTDACAQQCHTNNSAWQPQYCPDLHQTLCCEVNDSISTQIGSSGDALGILAQSALAIPAKRHPSNSNPNSALGSSEEWSQATKAQQQQQFSNCSFHGFDICHPLSTNSLNFSYASATTPHDGASSSNINTRASSTNGHIGNQKMHHNCPNPHHRKRRLNTCCVTHSQGSASASAPAKRVAYNRREVSLNTSQQHSHRIADQSNQIQQGLVSEFIDAHLQYSNHYAPNHDTQVPSFQHKQNLDVPMHGISYSSSQQRQIARAGQRHSHSCRHAIHSCCNPARLVYTNHTNGRNIPSTTQNAPDLVSSSVPSTPGPSISDQSSEYIYSPEAQPDYNYMEIFNATSEVKAKAKSPDCFGHLFPVQHNATFSESMNVFAGPDHGNRKTDKRGSIDLKHEPTQQPGKPKESSDTCKWVLNPEAISGKWITCNTKFLDPQELTAHFELHIEEDLKKRSNGVKKFYCRQLGCDRCNNTPFQQKGKLIRHVKSHSKDQRFQCEFCDKRFTTEDQRKTHVNMIHLGTKDHICDKCGRGFSSQNLLNNHKRSCAGHEEGKLKCPLCMYATHDSSNLGKHKKNCHPELTYRCLYPGCTFEPSQDFSEVKKHFSMTRHCTECSEDGSQEQDAYKLLIIKEARESGIGKKSRWDPRPLDDIDLG